MIGMKPRTTNSAIPRSKVRNGLIAVAVVALLAAGYGFPGVYNKASDAVNAKTGITLGHISVAPFRLGLDLRGGAHLMYDVDTSGVAESERASAVEGARDVIERRVNAFGVGEPIVQTTKVGEIWRVLVELPDVHDVREAIAQIGATPTLEFREQGASDGTVTPEQQKEIDGSSKQAKDLAVAALQDLKKGMSFDEFYKKNKGQDFGNVIQKDQADLFVWASKNRQGAVSDVIETAQGNFIVQRGAEKKEPIVTSRHILLCWKDAKNCESTLTKAEAEQKAKELLPKLNAQNFADLAKVNSMEPGANTSGGDLGEMRSAQLVKPFADALFGMKNGEIKGPIETEFGYHLIYKVSERQESSFALRGAMFAKKTAQDFLLGGQWRATGLSGKQLEKALVEFDQNVGEPTVALQFDAEGKELFSQITKRNIEKPVGIFLDGELISSPNVREAILDGRAIISGNFSIDTAKQLVERLNAGALPLPIKLVSQQTVGATLGVKSLEDSAKAGAIGFALVLIFLAAFYRLPGLLAGGALIVYCVIVLAIFKFIPVTMTLAGIAGFILSIGMAVDANVLVFERTREELATGKTPAAALEEAFPRAWNSIRDSNMSSLITCAILFWFGSSVVQGFALTLAIGILVSLFTAYTVTRLMLRFLAPYIANKPALFVQSK